MTQCKCCGKNTKVLVQDHDHFNGLNRDQICRVCNSVLTTALQQSLEKYVAYLNKWDNKHFNLMKSGSIPNQCIYGVKKDKSEVIPITELSTRIFSAVG